MSKDQDFKSYCDLYIESLKDGFSNSNHHNFIIETCNKFNIDKRQFRVRFKSIYGDSMAKAINNIKMPTQEEAELAIIKSNNASEVWKILQLPDGHKKSFYDKYFGVSTFQRAKFIMGMKTIKVDFNPNLDENKSLIASQILGDGSYSVDRKYLRLSHGEKQIDYAIWKASLINKAYPKTKPSGSTTILTHKQGHKCSSWCSGKLSEKLTNWIENTPKHEMVDYLTPFGILIYFLDDGCLNFDMTRRENHYVSMFIECDLVLKAMVGLLDSYGIKVTISKNVIKIGTYEGALSFYKNFIEPFKNVIPKCMEYKTLVKI